MLAEMERSKTKLKLEGMQLPYYIDYRVIELDDFNAEASFGALRNQARQHYRLLRVVVRVGDYKQDSYFGPAEGTLELASLDDDELALRHQLWLATDRAYKAATETLTAKQAQLKQFSLDQPVDDFAHAPVLQSIGERARLDFDPPVALQGQDVAAEGRAVHHQLGRQRVDRHRPEALQPTEDRELRCAQPARRQ